MRLVWLAAPILAAGTSMANAGFERWSIEIEDDPFSGGRKVVAEYMTSLRSGVLVICDTAEAGLTVRAIPGFTYVTALASVFPTIEFAFDGQRLLGAPGTTGSVGDNLAAAETQLNRDQATKFTESFAAARRQIAIKDGISDQPHLLKATGSTKAGQALAACVAKQM